MWKGGCVGLLALVGRDAAGGAFRGSFGGCGRLGGGRGRWGFRR